MANFKRGILALATAFLIVTSSFGNAFFVVKAAESEEIIVVYDKSENDEDSGITTILSVGGQSDMTATETYTIEDEETVTAAMIKTSNRSLTKILGFFLGILVSAAVATILVVRLRNVRQ